MAEYRPTMEFYEATLRGDLAWRIAQRVKDAERQLSDGRLETKEIRNAVDAALRAEMKFEVDGGRHRFVTRWVHHPVSEDALRDKESTDDA
jgi:hypothetical protein